MFYGVYFSTFIRLGSNHKTHIVSYFLYIIFKAVAYIVYIILSTEMFKKVCCLIIQLYPHLHLQGGNGFVRGILVSPNRRHLIVTPSPEVAEVLNVSS
jgi:uncharacterized membrane protein YagU involved in acid resistance